MKLFLKILLYIFLGLLACFGIGLVILSTYGGNSVQWRDQVQNIATQISGRQVSIRQLNDARIFPYMKFDGEYIFAAPFVNQKATQLDIAQTIVIRKLEFSVPFWSIFWGHPVMQHLRIEDLMIGNVKGLIVSQVEIRTPKDSPPQLAISGVLQEKAFTAKIELKRSGIGYMPKPDMAVSGIINGADITAILSINDQSSSLNDMTYTYNNVELNGTFLLEYDFDFQLDLNMGTKPYINVHPILKDSDTISAEAKKVSEITDDVAKNILISLCDATKQSYLLVKMQSEAEIAVACEIDPRQLDNQPMILDLEQETPNVDMKLNPPDLDEVIRDREE